MFRRRIHGLRYTKVISLLLLILLFVKTFFYLASDNLQIKLNTAFENLEHANSGEKNHQHWQQYIFDSPEIQQRLTFVNETCLRSPPRSIHNVTCHTSCPKSIQNVTCLRSCPKVVKNILTDREGRIANCIIPKVGSTFWINIFRFLLQDSTEHRKYNSPMDIPRMETHYGGKLTMTSIKSRDPPLSFSFNRTLRFMFVREPFSRLWSAWIDKFWLPDFWHMEAVKLAFKLNLTQETVSCPKNITFPLFLKYITLLDDPTMMNQHWAPYRDLCDPCLFRPHIIGKLETFTRDTRVILKAVNLTWVLNLPTNSGALSADRSLQEIAMLTSYNLEIWNQRGPKIQACFPKSELYKRLWKTFQYNGHLPADVDIPAGFLQAGNYSEQVFLDVCRDVYRNWNATGKPGLKEQRRAALVTNYRGVSADIMEKIQKMYALDFEMFGYDHHPTDLLQDKSR